MNEKMEGVFGNWFLAQSERDTPNPETLNSKGLDANLKKEEKEKKKSGLSAHAQTSNKQSSVVWSVAATLQRYLHNPPLRSWNHTKQP